MLCHRPLTRPVADGPLDAFAGVCLFCGQDLAAVHPQAKVRTLRVPSSESFTARRVPVMAAALHRGIVQRTIRQWKYDGCIEATPWLADVVMLGCGQVWPALSVDCVVAVPTALDRMQARGYDHVRLLTDYIAKRLQVPVRLGLQRGGGGPLVPGAPPQGRPTVSQTARSKRQRLESVTGAYQVSAAARFAGLNTLLIDDIVTTGATLQACATALLDAGANSVFAATIAWEE